MAARKRTERLAQSADQRERLDNCPSAARWSKDRNGHGRQTRLRLQQYSAIKVAIHAICAPSLGEHHSRPMRVARTITKALWA